jgi:hypothetical protein
MVTTVEYRNGNNVRVIRNVVPVGLELDPSESNLRNS